MRSDFYDMPSGANERHSIVVAIRGGYRMA